MTSQTVKGINSFHGIGGAFFPEQQPRSAWREYVSLIARAGLSFVRMGEFAWDKEEPREGKYDLAWLDEIMGMLDKKHVRVILCTPTAVPPIWACERYPEMFPVREDGKPYGFGVRRYTCPTSPAYHRLCEGIVARLAGRYAKNRQVLAWQIDNELGHPFCFCPRCLKHFREWCAKRFGTIRRFNDSLCTHFLGQTFGDFSEVPFPTTYPHAGLWMTWQKFFSEMTIECFYKQIRTLRSSGVTAPITTNYMTTWFGYDHEAMSAELDVTAGDHYSLNDEILFGDTFQHDMFAHAYLRGMKHGGNIWFHEYQWGRARNMPLRGETRWSALTQIGRGADLINFFRVDTCPNGIERDGYGLVGVHRRPGRIFSEIRKLSGDVAKIAKSIEGSLPVPSKAAFLFTFENHVDFARYAKHDSFSGGAGNGYAAHMSRHFGALTRCNIVCDIVYPNDDFSKYEIIVAPGLYILPRHLAEKLRRFVAGGGTLVMSSISGIADEHAKVWDVPAPANLTDVFGIEMRDYGAHYCKAGVVGIGGFADDFSCEPPGEVQWIDEIKLMKRGVKILARFENRFFDGIPAVTAAKYGKGKAIYLGAILDQIGYERFYRALAAWLKLEPEFELPEGLFATVRQKGRKKIIFINNPGPESRSFCPPGAYLDLLTGKRLEGTVTLKQFDVLVLVKCFS